MNKERVATQRLADIQALITYVKEGIDNLTSTENSENLDLMGSATLSILSTLQEIQSGIQVSEDQILDAHKAFTEKNYSQLEQPLLDILRTLEESKEIQQTNIKEIEQTYNQYINHIQDLQEVSAEHQEKEQAGRQLIQQGIDNLGDTLNQIDKKIPTEVSYQETLQEIKDTIRQLIEVERDKVYQNEEDLKLVDTELKLSQDLLMETNDRLDSIHATYEESTARLSVIDSKVDSMIRILVDNQQALGGMSNE